MYISIYNVVPTKSFVWNCQRHHFLQPYHPTSKGPFALKRITNLNDAVTQAEAPLQDDNVQQKTVSDNDPIQPSINEGVEPSTNNALRFGGESIYTSDPMPKPPRGKSLSDFFSNPKHQYIIWKGSNQTVDAYPDDLDDVLIRQKWKVQSSAIGCKMPREDDPIVIIKSPSIDVASVKIFPTTTMGTSCFTSNESGEPVDMPEIQAVLIEDHQTAEGPRFLVWLFNKIMFRDTKKTEDVGENSQVSLLRVWVEPQPCGTEVTFKSSVLLRMKIEFPSVLLKFFPMKKEKAEELCSKAILKQLDKANTAAMLNFCEEYVKW
eukprot:CAMPEP_0184866108 /NCGR_PEP_ID=MMETSP0580-20130426/20790_1 /TAXON_ID=1118495 /ORGANISM="Dactyliosolen fragilissimus" /LENGTH=319 /DNA_ID=CAMNT_0027365585 /DNA_START=138 /DNA_END=1094 /DNA_ORIENTATION=+